MHIHYWIPSNESFYPLHSEWKVICDYFLLWNIWFKSFTCNISWMLMKRIFINPLELRCFTLPSFWTYSRILSWLKSPWNITYDKKEMLVKKQNYILFFFLLCYYFLCYHLTTFTLKHVVQLLVLYVWWIECLEFI